MTASSSSYSEIVLEQWRRLDQILNAPGKSLHLNGNNATIAEIVAIARYNCDVEIDKNARDALEASRNALQAQLDKEAVIYGVNTGFGGTAHLRTKEIEQLQRVLIRELHYGILPPTNDAHCPDCPRNANQHSQETESSFHKWTSTPEYPSESLYLPKACVRATIAIRINSLLKGFSSVRPVIVDRLLDLLNQDIIPMIPTRGSISASGDLSPLSYIGGAIQGKPTIRILPSSNSHKIRTAHSALAAAGIEPVTLQAKEGLAIVNGTAVSAALGSLVLWDAHTLALLSHLLTAMSVEALLGTSESFHPFLSHARPHPGQIDSANLVLSFLHTSQLTQQNSGNLPQTLRQDRYSIRTAPQWLGPVLEDLTLAHQQLSIELNSATDNPLIDPTSTTSASFHGGNFQARAPHAAMEKTRQSLHLIGRMLFAQLTEMINPSTSRGLPPNLVAEDPSTSFIFKGADIYAAALQAELGFLAGPVNHVMCAEMGNQSLNSLALVAARYTATAVEVLAQLNAVHAVAVCQALDLRAIGMGFFEEWRAGWKVLVEKCFADGDVCGGVDRKGLEEVLWAQLLKCFDDTVSMDAEHRFPAIAKGVRDALLDLPGVKMSDAFWQAAQKFKEELALTLRESWCAYRDAYMAHVDASHLLGRGSRRLYRFVRHDLKVPFLCTARLETPPSEQEVGQSEGGAGDVEEEPMTVGSYYGKVYRAVKDGRVARVMMDIVEEVKRPDENGSERSIV
ncbi:uncharacterized protein KY384_007230 [Bacidia gigantensis]|uniref:uncharacterized protein n=1 Tax=Bacidia gigantensis TaxID=2732470 RepID=UPI001D04FC30|nr:uncharacterized protein KY384_007230 [Bacidia gigantensis]KAG8528313.1 hypothetical protein KY384_007230 [Bacidia gigantensis]